MDVSVINNWLSLISYAVESLRDFILGLPCGIGLGESLGTLVHIACGG